MHSARVLMSVVTLVVLLAVAVGRQPAAQPTACAGESVAFASPAEQATPPASPITHTLRLPYIARNACRYPPAHRVASANLDTDNARLLALSVHTPDDIWAVGFLEGGAGALTLHWDGTRWTNVPTPNVAHARHHELYDVVALAPNDAWAVGFSSRDYNGDDADALALHWDGVRWSETEVPNGDLGGALIAVAGRSGSDVWAVGGDYADHPLLLHWDGLAWSQVALPSVGPGLFLNALTVLPSGEVWVVGDYRDAASERTLTLTLRWNGTTWSPVASPSLGAYFNTLNDVTAIGPNDIWAVGRSQDVPNGVSQMLALHWDGAAWSQVATPTPGAQVNRLVSVTGRVGNDVWAVGTTGDTDNALGPLILHWDGVGWTVAPTPPTTRPSFLADIAVVGDHDVWAVGGRHVLAANDTWTLYSEMLAFHWTGATWTAPTLPRVGAPRTRLLAVTALSGGPAWAAGYYQTGPDQVVQGGMLRWDGSTWQPVALPAMGRGGLLQDVVALAPNDVWAVGGMNTDSAEVFVILHWDGQQWTITSGERDSWLHAVSARTPNDVWAVGSTYGATLTLHWDGHQWQQVRSPAVGDQDYLYGVAATAPNDAWAVGSYSVDNDDLDYGLMLHWDGRQWQEWPFPHQHGASELKDVVALAGNDAWAGGWYADERGPHALLLHWDGMAWREVTVGAQITSITSLSARSPSDIWAVGSRAVSGATGEEVVLHWDGQQWRQVELAGLPPGRLDQTIGVIPEGGAWLVGAAPVPSPSYRPGYESSTIRIPAQYCTLP